MELFSKINDTAAVQGITYVGVADLAGVQKVVLEQGGTDVAGYPYAVSLGITLFNTIVDELNRRSERTVALNYKHHAYDLVNLRLDLAASLIGGIIQGEGYRALPVPASKRYDEERLTGAFSHKMGAHLAGLGWIGKSCLLVTREDGPRVRWVTVLTDAPLEPTGQPEEERCGSCTKCVDICPTKAFTGQPFREHEPREARYDARKCDKYFKAMENSGRTAVCGLCLYVCPYGKKSSVFSR